jgi:site-specific recombinase XerD
MPDTPLAPETGLIGEVLPTGASERAAAALATAQAYAEKAAAPATLRAYKADWAHYAQWCAAVGLAPVPAAPATVGAYLASLESMRSFGVIRPPLR